MATALTEPDPGLGATSLSLLGSSSSHVEPQSSCAANSSACWPHMFLVGAQKSATTSLFDLFHRNGAACGASYLPDQGMFKPRHQFFSPKEVHLFDAPPDEFAEVVREPALADCDHSVTLADSGVSSVSGSSLLWLRTPESHLTVFSVWTRTLLAPASQTRQ